MVDQLCVFVWASFTTSIPLIYELRGYDNRYLAWGLLFTSSRTICSMVNPSLPILSHIGTDWFMAFSPSQNWCSLLESWCSVMSLVSARICGDISSFSSTSPCPESLLFAIWPNFHPTPHFGVKHLSKVI